MESVLLFLVLRGDTKVLYSEPYFSRRWHNLLQPCIQTILQSPLDSCNCQVALPSLESLLLSEPGKVSSIVSASVVLVSVMNAQAATDTRQFVIWLLDGHPDGKDSCAMHMGNRI